MKRADSLLASFIRESGIEEGVTFEKIKKDWGKLFPEPILLHMAPCRLSHGELLLSVDSPVWLQELSFLKEDIVKKLNSYGIKSIRFRLGKVSNPQAKGQLCSSRKFKARSLTHEEQLYVESEVSVLNDEELKKVIRNAIIKSILAGKVS